MASFLDPAWLPYFMVGLANVALAAWLLILDVRGPVNRAFSLLLFLRGISLMAGPASDLETRLPQQIALYNVFPYLIIPLLPLVVYFLSNYPVRRSIFGTTRWAPWLLAAVTIGTLTWYMFDHSAYALRSIESGRMATAEGPLIILRGLRLPILAFAALVLARDYSRDPHGSHGFSVFLLAAGFTLNALFDGIAYAWRGIASVQSIGWVGWLTSGGGTVALSVLCLPIAIGALAYMARAMRHERDDATLQEARRFLLIAVPIVAFTAVLAGEARIRGSQNLSEFIRGFWNLLVPATIAYALMRYSLFKADLKLKAGVQRGIIIGAFTLTFFVVMEAAEAIFQGSGGAALGIGVAALIALAASPLQSFARSAADALMPDTKPIEAMTMLERRRLYHDQFMLVSRDGVVTQKERAMLTSMAAALGVEAEAAAMEENGPEGFPDGDLPEPVQTPGKSRLRTALSAALVALSFGAFSQAVEGLVSVSDFGAGLISAAFIALMLGPLQSLAERILGRRVPADARSLSLYHDDLVAAMADGALSRRDRIYLKHLAQRLGLDRQMRAPVHRAVVQKHPVRFARLRLAMI